MSKVIEKERYMQAFKANYSMSGFSIPHGGKNDIDQHRRYNKHIKNAEANAKNEKEKNKMRDFLLSKNEVIRAECLFTAFLIEHNIPLSCADHIGSLLRKIFPKDEIAKNYSCARTKTSAIASEMASTCQSGLITALQNQPFCLATDGSNDSGSKLYPIVATHFNNDNGQVESSLLAIPALKGDSTAANISNLVCEKLNQLNIPISNCIAFGSDNAYVMVGRKAGVAQLLKE